jgi:hypothetical protein
VAEEEAEAEVAVVSGAVVDEDEPVCELVQSRQMDR